MKSVLVNSLIGQAIYVDCKNKFTFENGKVSDKLESTNLMLMSREGDFQVVLPPDEKKCKLFQERFSFGDKIEVEEVVNITDIKVSIYRDNLSVKILADYKEDENV